MSVSIGHAVTSGTFSLDGGTWDVDNNVWVIGDAAECVVIDAPVRLHPADEPLWRMTYPDLDFVPLADGERVVVAGTELAALHTPGHAPGAMTFHAPELAAVFTGDTLFRGGPGATGRSFSSFPAIIESIRDRVLTLPAETAVHTGQCESTTVGEEAPHLAEWLARGW